MYRFVVLASLMGFVSASSASPTFVRAVQTLSDLAERGVALNHFEYSETCPARQEGVCQQVGAEAVAAEWQHTVSTIGRTELREQLGREGVSEALSELMSRARAVGRFQRCEQHSNDGKIFQRRVVFTDTEGRYCPSFTLGYND